LIQVKRKKANIKYFLLSLSALVLTASSVSAEEETIHYNSQTSGSFSVRTWMQTNSVDQKITLNKETGFVNAKMFVNSLQFTSNYWFGYINQNQLFTLGSIFGVGIDFTYGKNGFYNLNVGSEQSVNADLISYYIDLSFLKLALLHDERMKNYLAITGNYTTYSNSVSGSINMNGLAVGLDSQFNLGNLDANLKLNYVPNTNAGRLVNSWGSNGELNFKYFFSPKAAFTFGYKASYYTGIAYSTANVPSGDQGKTTKTDIKINLEDINNGVVLGATYYF
jgi:hypothetical protein